MRTRARSLRRWCLTSSTGALASMLWHKLMVSICSSSTQESRCRLPDVPGLIRRHIADGTRNFTREPAMTEDQMNEALEAGFARSRSGGDGWL